jgi:hypothetical protein
VGAPGCGRQAYALSASAEDEQPPGHPTASGKPSSTRCPLMSCCAVGSFDFTMLGAHEAAPCLYDGHYLHLCVSFSNPF